MGMSETVKDWGSTAAERERPLPCDALVPEANAVLHRAVDVAAPPGVVFRWLCQLRAGPYSYDWIDNFGKRSPQELTPGLDELEPGQRFMTIFRLAEFEPGSRITLESHGGRMAGHAAVTYLVTPNGDSGSRLLLRIAWKTPRLPLFRSGLAAGDFVMSRRQLLNLKALAERGA
jgi:hypothetical protein